MLCAFTKEKLLKKNTIAICKCGNLFDKETAINYLMERRKMPKGLEHIRKLKDIKDVQFLGDDD